MLIIYSGKEQMWQRQTLCKSGFIEGPPRCCEDKIYAVTDVYIHSIIMWRYFEYFISLQPLGVSRETLQKDKHQPESQTLCSPPAVFTPLHSSAADIVTSLTEVLM